MKSKSIIATGCVEAMTNWSKPQNIHEISYASLQNGNYFFEVRTIGWNGEFGNIASFHFIIQPPFWKTFWFIGLCIFVLSILFYALHQYRYNQLLKLQKVRNRIATDLHDDIGSSLTNINILSRLSKQHVAQPEQEGFLNRISEEVNLSAQALDDIIWSVNTRNDTMEQTVARMRRYAAELFDAGNVHYEFEMEPAIAERKMDMELRRDFYLIYKEAVNNICKHANASDVHIKVGIEKNSLYLIIKDNGKGFDRRMITHRNGLKNLHARVERWKGHLDMHSQKSEGTLIKATLPLV